MILSSVTPFRVLAASAPEAPENLSWTDSGADWDAPSQGDEPEFYQLSLFKQSGEDYELVMQLVNLTATEADLKQGILLGGEGSYFYTVSGVNEVGESPEAVSPLAGFALEAEETPEAEPGQDREPVEIDPVVTEPADQDEPSEEAPAESDPAQESEPSETQPAESDPAVTDPAPAEPVVSDPAQEGEPSETQPAESDPAEEPSREPIQTLPEDEEPETEIEITNPTLPVVEPTLP
ncbi:MAG: hypothetical protein J6H18_03940, partial [Lachnospiraceae bacterium]|nr:hypothetical protein [Lachnospiraceae bacterium]